MVDVTLGQCVILMSDMGEQLAASTTNTPKPLLNIEGRTFLHWLMRELVRFGVEEFVLLINDGSDQLEQAVAAIKNDLPHPVEIILAEIPLGAGTGGALYQASHLLRDRFLLCHGDRLLNWNLALLLRDWAADDADTIGRMVMRTANDASGDTKVALDGDRVIALSGHHTMGQPGIVNAGLYAFDRRILEFLSLSCSLKQDALPRMALKGALRGTLANSWSIDLTTPNGLEQAGTDLCQRLRRPALFLARDGVLNHDHGWVGTQERWD